ncbi:unnamed protein product [Cyprideis torosa]|uniref:Uncharacterized protein n=1 Tax=Cyprideis torosa TaxID=163714 RepID=A0A7R8ZQW4_9CRUS|nr:unnamed protein product [Cyprideis torosa]CAG0892934.1 unnamed protein product [Cyprideis torosa]
MYVYSRSIHFPSPKIEKAKTSAKEVYEGQCDFPFLAVDGGYCYFMSKSLLAMTWEEAQTICGWMHPQGRLAEFTTAEELVQATLFLLDNDPSCNSWSAPPVSKTPPATPGAPVGRNFEKRHLFELLSPNRETTPSDSPRYLAGPWIGAREIEDSNEFVWASTNSSISHANWGPGQPNSETSGDSVALDCEYSYAWVDMAATNDGPVLCEIPANAPPEVIVCPTDFILVGPRCYHTGPNWITWYEAVQYCHNAAPSATNPKLAEFEKEEELQTVIMEHLLTVCHPPECDRCFWIGAEERRWDERYPNFVWVSSGTPMTYNSWAPGRPWAPESGTGYGVEICSNIMYILWDVPKDYTHPFALCEADPIVS